MIDMKGYDADFLRKIGHHIGAGRSDIDIACEFGIPETDVKQLRAIRYALEGDWDDPNNYRANWNRRREE